MSKTFFTVEDENLITNWGNPHQVIITQYGEIKRLKWQRLEAKRIGNCRIIFTDDGLFSAVARGVKDPKECATVAAMKENTKFKKGLKCLS